MFLNNKKIIFLWGVTNRSVNNSSRPNFSSFTFLPDSPLPCYLSSDVVYFRFANSFKKIPDCYYWSPPTLCRSSTYIILGVPKLKPLLY